MLLEPDDVDELEIAVEVDGTRAASETYELSGPSRGLSESLTILPGSAADDSIRVLVSGLHAGAEIARGAENTRFAGGQILEIDLHLDWLASACIDADRDGYGRGPGCPDDCDDGAPGVHPGAAEDCNGLDDDCDGSTDEELDAPRCALFKGVCATARKRCAGPQGWQDCSTGDYGERYERDEESCDGFDNDCDGSMDELCPCAQGQTHACTGPDEGICSPGEQVCEQVGGQWRWSDGCEGEIEPRDEECNQLDDDCDGQTDEEFDLGTDVEHCGECNHACRFDHASGRCEEGTCTISECEPGYHDADGAADNGCECRLSDPPEEICDGLDNDCNGQIDDGLVPPGCELGLGVCSGVEASCEGEAGWVCDYGPSYEEIETRCDGLDNDCDGEADGLDGDLVLLACEKTQGVCAGSVHMPSQCSPGGWQPCDGSSYGADYEEEETRLDDELDNDCDGQTDEQAPAVDTRITLAPLEPSETDFAVFEFECSEEDCTFDCQLDGRGFWACRAPRVYVRLSNGPHTFQVRAIDASLQEDPTPAVHAWTVAAEHIDYISAGFSHSCAVNRSRVVKCWGSNDYGQLGDGTDVDSNVPVDVSWLPPNMVAVSAGHWFSCALSSGGAVWCWGYNQSGQLGDDSQENRFEPVSVAGLSSGIVAIETGFAHACALRDTGAVECWGDNEFGQLGNGFIVDSHIPVAVAGLGESAVSISAEGNHSCAIMDSGDTKCWGLNQNGQLGDGGTSFQVLPVDVVGLSSAAVEISAEYRHTCALTGPGGVECWGGNGSGQLGDGSTDESHSPVQVIGLPSDMIAVSSGSSHTCALDGSGGAMCWGANSYGQLGDGTDVESHVPVDVDYLSSGIIAISAGNWHSCAVTASLNVRCWGYNLFGQVGDGSNDNRFSPVDVIDLSTGVVAIAGGMSHSCAITAGRGVRCWGRNSDGQIGDGSNDDTTVPVDVVGLSDVLALASGHYHSCAVTEAGEAWCWGRNTDGQLGDGGYGSQNAPVPVSGISNAIGIAAGSAHSCVLTADHAVECWGDNSSGQLGNSSYTDSPTPVHVTGLSTTGSALSAGAFHTCARTTGGGVKCWGRNTDGQLGDNSTDDRNAPVDVLALSGVSDLNVKSNHSCAVAAGGAARCWGDNQYGQLGDGGWTDASVPIDVVGLSMGSGSIAPGGMHTCVLTDVGSVKCWGANSYGQLGDGSNSPSPLPVNVSGLSSGVVGVAGGQWHTCAITGTGGVKCWGYNLYGQLGDGSNDDSNSPVDVVGF
ncbi:MAG: hypothetical protein JXR96_12570 [Deltaproteobacteria bacterium]|nr:hypothetical protein [Deltaproteobacteria bacterium]